MSRIIITLTNKEFLEALARGELKIVTRQQKYDNLTGIVIRLEDKGDKEYDQTGTHRSNGLGARNSRNAESLEQLEEE